jgi:hypothetical protein
VAGEISSFCEYFGRVWVEVRVISKHSNVSTN